jgi:hypothetical protein
MTCLKIGLGVWVPAYAGTTWRDRAVFSTS